MYHKSKALINMVEFVLNLALPGLGPVLGILTKGMTKFLSIVEI